MNETIKNNNFIQLTASEVQTLVHNWQAVTSQIAQCDQHINQENPHKEHHSKLIAVSKTKPVDMIITLAKEGQQDFAENYLQESIDKIDFCQQNYPNLNIIWHYIGHIQRNKTKEIAENFSWVHTLERDLIAKRLNEQRPEELPKLNILIQVNIDNEENKSGCTYDKVVELVNTIKQYPRLTLRGLMAIPAKDSPDAFVRMQTLFCYIRDQQPKLEYWDTLSMGMSADMQEAINSGSTMVRVGTAIFGNRS